MKRFTYIVAFITAISATLMIILALILPIFVENYDILDGITSFLLLGMSISTLYYLPKILEFTEETYNESED